MNATRFLGILFISCAAVALPASAQNGRLDTPATLDGCDSLADKTPGLQGLCVALCEAQTCEAEVTESGLVEYGPGCEPSAPRLVANFVRMADPAAGDPQYPFCVKVQCPCWTREDLATIGGVSNDQCYGQGVDARGWAWLQGGASDRGVGEYALASGLACASQSADREPRFLNASGFGAAAYQTCLQTVRDECAARGKPLPE